MNTNTITLDDTGLTTPNPSKIYFKVDLPSHKLRIEAGTVIMIAKAAKDLYDIIQQSKEKKKDNVGDWLLTIDRKLDVILNELTEIKYELRKIEELIKNIHFDFAVKNLENNIRYFQMNIFNLKENPNDIATKNKFTNVNAELQIDMFEIIRQSAFYYVYDVILAFVIQFDLSYGLDNVSKYSKLNLIDITKSFLVRALDKNVKGSFGQILQINLNSKTKLSVDFQSYEGMLRRFCILEEYKVPSSKHDPGGDYSAKIARVGFNYSITGDIESDFALTTSYIQPYEARWVNHKTETNGLFREQQTKEAITVDLNTIIGNFKAACQQYSEVSKNVDYYKGIVDDINKYLTVLDELTAKVQTE